MESGPALGTGLGMNNPSGNLTSECGALSTKRKEKRGGSRERLRLPKCRARPLRGATRPPFWALEEKGQ